MYKTFLKHVASLQIIVGLVMLVPSVVALIYQEWYSLAGFLAAGIFTALVGLFFYRMLKHTEDPEDKHTLAIAAIGWLTIVIFGALPYLLIAWFTPEAVMQKFVPPGETYTSSLLNFRNPLHCLFESTSAFTTTGLTMAYHEPSVGKTILFYRSFSQWVGGAGFIVMALAIFKSMPGQEAMSLYGSESSGRKLRTNVVNTARAIWKVYVTLTLAMIVYLFIGTLFILPEYPITENIFDAVNHALAGLSTGGFSTLDNSIASYESVDMEMLFLTPMIIGSLAIPFYYRLIFQQKISELWNDLQTRSVIIAYLFGSVTLSLFLINSNSVDDPFRYGVFQFISALSTTGWSTGVVVSWDDISLMFLVLGAMIIGGSAGSTVGGIKIIRVQLLQKGLIWRINKLFFSKNSIKTVKFNNKIMLERDMNSELAGVSTFVFIYILFVFISTLFTLQYMGGDFTLADAIFESASAQGTVGLSTGITAPSMSPVLETIYVIQMWAGRLEIIPILILIRVLIYGIKSKII